MLAGSLRSTTVTGDEVRFGTLWSTRTSWPGCSLWSCAPLGSVCWPAVGTCGVGPSCHCSSASCAAPASTLYVRCRALLSLFVCKLCRAGVYSVRLYVLHVAHPVRFAGTSDVGPTGRYSSSRCPTRAASTLYGVRGGVQGATVRAFRASAACGRVRVIWPVGYG